MRTKRSKPEDEVVLEKLQRLRAKILNENKALQALIDAISDESRDPRKQLTKKS
jgi:hypothetical protein